MQTFEAAAARQGVAVDEGHFYAVGSVDVTKHRKSDGASQQRFDGATQRPSLLHLDSGVVHRGMLYAAHSNYPELPMTSSIEVWDAANLVHVASHSLGVLLGSMTWLDRHDGFWWGCFANYDKVQPGHSEPYGRTDRTVIVKMDDRFRILRQWTLPASVLDRMRPMSNSGGSWGPDELLYLTGHDRPELYAVTLPESESKASLRAIVHAPGNEGQGIAWDRSTSARVIWGIFKRERRVVRLEIPPLPRTATIDPPARRQAEGSGSVRQGGDVVGHDDQVAGAPATIDHPVGQQRLGAETELLEQVTSGILLSGHLSDDPHQSELVSDGEDLTDEKVAEPAAATAVGEDHPDLADVTHPVGLETVEAGVADDLAVGLGEQGDAIVARLGGDQVVDDGGIGDVAAQEEQVFLGQRASEDEKVVSVGRLEAAQRDRPQRGSNRTGVLTRQLGFHGGLQLIRARTIWVQDGRNESDEKSPLPLTRPPERRAV